MAGRARVAVTAIFFLNGAAFAGLFSRLPELQREHGLSDGALGLILLGGTLGLMVSQLLAGALVVRTGSRPVTLAGALGGAVLLPLPALAPSAGLFAAAMITVLTVNGVLDVAMNTQGIAVERRHPRRIFASFHAAFSFGALAGAAAGGLSATAGVAPEGQLVGAAIVLAVLALAVRPWLLEAAADARREGPAFARPSRALAALGAVAFCVLLAEGAVNDWSAIHLRRSLEASPGLAAAGLAAFSLTMGIGRLAADRLADALGAQRIVRLGGLLAAGGLSLALLGGSPAAGIAGFAAMGAGLSGIFPLALDAATRTGTEAGPALAAVSTTGYVGFVAGPPTIGLVSEATSLPTALALVVALCLVAAALAGAVGRSAPGSHGP